MIQSQINTVMDISTSPKPLNPNNSHHKDTHEIQDPRPRHDGQDQLAKPLASVLPTHAAQAPQYQASPSTEPSQYPTNPIALLAEPPCAPPSTPGHATGPPRPPQTLPALQISAEHANELPHDALAAFDVSAAFFVVADPHEFFEAPVWVQAAAAADAYCGWFWAGLQAGLNAVLLEAVLEYVGIEKDTWQPCKVFLGAGWRAWCACCCTYLTR